MWPCCAGWDQWAMEYGLTRHKRSIDLHTYCNNLITVWGHNLCSLAFPKHFPVLPLTLLNVWKTSEDHVVQRSFKKWQAKVQHWDNGVKCHVMKWGVMEQFSVWSTVRDITDRCKCLWSAPGDLGDSFQGVARVHYCVCMSRYGMREWVCALVMWYTCSKNCTMFQLQKGLLQLHSTTQIKHQTHTMCLMPPIQ